MTKKKILIYLQPLCILFNQTPVWAVQTHGGEEGLVAHQIGHFLFIVGMCIFLFWLHRDKKLQKNWLEFKIFIWLILAWNILTFTGHALHKHIAANQFIYINNKLAGFHADSLADYIFYLSRLDHLLLVPAIFFLFLAVKIWGRHTAEKP